MPRPKKYPDELVQRGIRLALESERPIAHIAADLGMHPETLRKKVRQHEADSGKRPDLPTSQEREEIRRLRAENFELRQANEIWRTFLRNVSGCIPRSAAMCAIGRSLSNARRMPRCTSSSGYFFGRGMRTRGSPSARTSSWLQSLRRTQPGSRHSTPPFAQQRRPQLAPHPPPRQTLTSRSLM